MTGANCLAADFQATPYWWVAAPPESTAHEPLPSKADVVVVGAGFCGLSAAAELGGAGRSTVVLDAGPLGTGGSSRSGGMVTGGQKFVVSGALAAHPAERQQAILEDAKASLDHIEAIIARHDLDAEYQRCGRLITAFTPAHYNRLETWAMLLDAYAPGTVELIPAARLEEEIGGGFYFGALLIKNYGGLHPAKYNRALRRFARSKGATVIGNCPVNGIVRDGTGFRIETPRGMIRADQVLLATNGYSDTAGDFLRARVIGAASYIIATEPLPRDVLQRINPHCRMISDTKRSLAYFRLSPDRTRVVFGGRVNARDRDEALAATGLFEQMCEIWPDVRDFKLTHCWRGNVGMTYDHIPHLGVHDGAHYAVGCNGSGVAMMTYLGHQAALKMLGRQNRPCAFESDSFPKVPLTAVRSLLVPAVTRWYMSRDWLDRQISRRRQSRRRSP